jgi:hypothetical protein
MNTARKSLTMLLFALCVTTSFGQTIRRVNNTGIPLGTNMYDKLQLAHNAAADGDIIYVEGSGTAYDNLVCTKKLTIIGPGYLLGENYTYFSDLRSANLGTVTFDPGSAGSSLVGVSSVSVTVKVPNVIISRNTDISITANSVNAPITGLVITKNYAVSIHGSNYANNLSAVISNNYVTQCDMDYITHSGTFFNNIIDWNTSLHDFNVFNNILLGGSVALENCNVYNNIDAKATANSTAFGTTNGNLGNVDKTKLFVGPTQNSTDGQWRLITGSVAIGAGFNGTDCGIYGGSTPYEVSGLSSLDYPAITSFTTSGSGSDTTPLNVTISTKSN